jgi:hypothetical protein
MVSRSVTSTTPDITGLDISKKNLGSINRTLPASSLDQLIPLNLESKEETVATKFLDTEKDSAQNFLTPIVKGTVLGASGRNG